MLKNKLASRKFIILSTISLFLNSSALLTQAMDLNSKASVLPISEKELNLSGNQKNSSNNEKLLGLERFPPNIDENLNVRVLLNDVVYKVYIQQGNKQEIRYDYKTFAAKFKDNTVEFGSDAAFFEVILEAFGTDALKYNLKKTNKVQIKKKGAALEVILKLPLEEYLSVVVGSEIPSSWPTEALKAQAVTARTYLLNQLEFSADSDYDVASSVADQRFNGTEKISERSINAVKTTKNQVIIDKYGLLAKVFYSSSHGGFISAPEFTWKLAAKHYLISKPAYPEDGPFNSWQRKFSHDELNDLVGISFFNVEEILPMASDYLLISKDAKKTKLLIGEELRHKLSLPSSSFTPHKDGDKWIFAGRGFGHGIGMSQYGAKTMANNGNVYAEIIGFYYPQTRIISL
ncbi:MAG: SpoIID/LytB domain-containing protein [Vampirovibrionia bacterium]